MAAPSAARFPDGGSNLWDTQFTRLARIDLPIALAPMGNNASTPELVAAVSNAGALGILGCVGLPPEEIRLRIRRTRDLTDHTFGVNIPLYSGVSAKEPAGTGSNVPESHRRFVNEFASTHGLSLKGQADAGEAHLGEGFSRRQFDVILEEQVAVFSSGLGISADIVDTCHQAGMLVISSVGSLRHATRAREAGCDLITAQGAEAGGHTGQLGSMVLIPLVVDAVSPTPVIGAGGIGNGGALAAVMALGAVGGWVGTAFLAAEECGIAKEIKQLLIKADERATVVTRSISGLPLRSLRSPWSESFDASGLPPLGVAEQGQLSNPIFTAVREAGRFDIILQSCGQVVAGITSIRPAAEIVASLVSQAESVLRSLGGSDMTRPVSRATRAS
jgi:nitronate monooxygenase